MVVNAQWSICANGHTRMQVQRRGCAHQLCVRSGNAPGKQLRCSSFYASRRRRGVSYTKCRASKGQDVASGKDVDENEQVENSSNGSGKDSGDLLTTNEMQFEELGNWRKACSAVKMFFAPPWSRCKSNSVLTLKFSGVIEELLPTPFSRAASLPAICEALVKAAYDPRIKGLYIAVEILGCGWAKVTEIKRHIEFFRQSGKFTIAYLDRGGEKEYFLASACEEVYVPPSGFLSIRGLSVQGTFLRGAFDKAGIEPQVRRMGNYKSAGDQFLREDMSEYQREQLTDILDDLYGGFVSGIARSRGIGRDKVEELLNGQYTKMENLKEAGLVTDLKYKDQILDMVKERLGVKKEDKVPYVALTKYRRVSLGTFGLKGGERIAVVRASGAITMENLSPAGGSDGIIPKIIIRDIRKAVEDKKIKAIVLRIDSPGGDSLASDLIWREVQRAAEEKPVIASMGDLAASGGYYIAMAADKIVAESLTLTGSIGVVLSKFSLGELYKKIGISKENLSIGRYAELFTDNRSFTEDEDDFFSKLVVTSYEDFRDRAAESRGMEIQEMEKVAQGRVWSGKRGANIGLVDEIGGLQRAIALAKEAADIDAERNVTLVEMSRKKASFLEVLQAGGSISNVICSALFLLYGIWTGATSYAKGSDLWNGAGWTLFGALGIADVVRRASKVDPNWEYTMEEVEINNSAFIAPQAIMDDSLLISTLIAPAVKDLVEKLRK